ncbi:MAG: 50S ribosomal protein L3 [Parcubacteria group bacterium GW2011_GWC2_45_7]|nr:MAG: 50S ribosomal protein L3 [Parcubacteria group bacterium GW2011_GWC2_45_7]
MTEQWDSKGRLMPATIIEAGPCYVTQLRTSEKDGYSAVQLGFGTKKILTKAMQQHLKDLPKLRWLRECKLQDKEIKRGDVINVAIFAPGDIVKVTGVSKGKGFQGLVKRHGFHGHPATHGHKDQARMPGAIGAGGLQHVRKGQRMAGRMGGERVSVRNLEVVSVDKEKNRLVVKGAVPGARNGLLMISAL